MKIKYDPKVDAMRIEFKPVSFRCRELSEDIILDIGPNEEICGIEILSASKKLFENPDEPNLSVENITILK